MCSFSLGFLHRKPKCFENAQTPIKNQKEGEKKKEVDNLTVEAFSF